MNLSITVAEAQLNYDVDRKAGKGNQDPYVTIQLGNQKQKTKVATNQGKTPIWNETFQFSYDTKNPNLKVTVFDSNPQKKNSDVQLGEGIINLVNAEQAPEWIVSVPLYKNQEDVGNLNLQFDFIGKQKPKKQLDSTSPINQSQNKSSNSIKPQEKQNNNKEPLQPLQPPKINIQTIYYDKQQSDLQNQVDKILNQQYISTLQYLNDSKLTMIIQEALNQIAVENPKNQIDYFAQYLLNQSDQ